MRGSSPGWHALRYSEGRAEAATASPSSKLREHGLVHFQLHRPQSRVPARAGPFPLFRSGNQSATDRVGMDVLNHCRQRFGADDVAVVAAARLPEAMPHARAFAHRDAGQPVRRVCLQVADRFAADGRFYRLQETRHLLRSISGIDKNMNVLRHEDVGPELKTEFRACFVERLAKPFASAVAGQERVLTIAGKRQLARLAGLVVADSAFFNVAFARLGIDDSHEGQDMLLSRLLQQVTLAALRHALRSTSGRATRRKSEFAPPEFSSFVFVLLRIEV